MEEDREGDERTIAIIKDQAAAALALTLARPTAVNDVPITRAELATREAAVRSLRRRDREIYLAHRLDDMSYAAIAQATGLSVAQVERAMTRAIIGINRHLHGAPQRRWWWPF
ncbi:sigma factor-like helix-turn-helix DNA-binding protein [Sphingomonas aquatilis]|uniref:sigma-70 region 4 domain-containing protein n=1 Tax=Sphingomonas aquatilis TaxID=93063 RepID=UPI0023F85892|nr:sigma-70 region 4 domain-containing protein [Sphingomonas aquatilis]MCI4655900.1 sigma-70 region 4 domain-containing protein [Sphingomonas aquatilis]